MLRNDLAQTISLDGIWSLRTLETGIVTEVQVPACWEAQGLPKTLDGPVVYRRRFFVPAAWAGARVVVEFDGVSHAADVRCNHLHVGEHVGLWTPFAIDVSAAIRLGEFNILEVEAVKPCHRLTGGQYPMRSTLAGFLPDVATTFGGIWRSVRLRRLDAGIGGLTVDADPASGSVRARGRVDLSSPGAPVSLEATIVLGTEVIVRHQVPVTHGDPFDLCQRVPCVKRWRPDQPVLYGLTLRVHQGGEELAGVTERFGFRSLSATGECLLLNDLPVVLRGVLSWGWDPATIAPQQTREQARTEMRRLRALGFNLIKLCLFIPDQFYYEVADEEGMFLWQEWPLWLPEITPELRTRMPAEYGDYMALARHHPSVVIYSLGCELGRHVDQALIGQLDAVARGAVDNVLFCDNSGSGEAYGGLPVDFADFSDYHTYGELHYLEPSLDHWRRDWQPLRPWIFGEFCDSDGFRDRGAIIAANGGEPPWWMTEENPVHEWRPEVRALAEADARLAAVDPNLSSSELVAIANAQSLMVRKYTLETVRKRREVQGYVITGLRDTPIAASGILDDFGQPKWPVESFRAFNNDAILCLDVGRSRVWQHGGDRPDRLDCYNWAAGEPIRLHVILGHAGPGELDAGQLSWRLATDDGQAIASASHAISRRLPAGRPTEIGVVEAVAPDVVQAISLDLSVNFCADGLDCANHWRLWIYPNQQNAPERAMIYAATHRGDGGWATYGSALVADHLPGHGGTVITDRLDEPLLAFLSEGGRVLLNQVGYGSLSVQRLPFWREAIKVMMPHALWRRFPNDGHVDLQFFGLATDAAFDVAQLSKILPDLCDYRPILRRLDAREFTVTDYLFEARVGRGRLIASSLRLQGGAGSQPTGLARNVAGRHLLATLLVCFDGA